jgi:hypothetical protein
MQEEMLVNNDSSLSFIALRIFWPEASASIKLSLRRTACTLCNSIELSLIKHGYFFVVHHRKPTP